MIICDTDVIIEHFKGNPDASNLLHSIGSENIGISAITEMELLFGARNKRESKQIRSALSELSLFHLDSRISEIAIELISTYSKSHNLRIPDALIASTAIIYDIELLTFNVKDFSFIKELSLFKRK